MRIPRLVPAQWHATLPQAADGNVEIWREDGQICAYGYLGDGHEWMQRMTEAYLQLVAEVPVYRPVFAAGFEGSDGVVDVVEQLLR